MLEVQVALTMLGVALLLVDRLVESQRVRMTTPLPVRRRRDRS